MNSKEKELFTQALNLITELDKEGLVLEMGLILEMRQALAQPEQVITPISPDQYERLCGTCGACTGKPWVGLTLNDITGHICNCADDDGTYQTSCFIDYAKAIEQKLKDLNT